MSLKNNRKFLYGRHILSCMRPLFVANNHEMNSAEFKNQYLSKFKDLCLDQCLKIRESCVEEISAFNLFCHFYGCIPQIETCFNVNCNGLVRKLWESYQDQIITQFYSRQYDIEHDELIKTNFIILLTHEIAIHVNHLEQYVKILYGSAHISEVRSIWSKVREIHFTNSDCQNSNEYHDANK